MSASGSQEMGDQQEAAFATLEPHQLLQGLTQTLGEIIERLQNGQQVSQELLQQGNHWWAAIDQHPPSGDSPISFPLEGEGNLLRTMLYDLEHGQAIDEGTIEHAQNWLREVRERNLLNQ